MLWRCIVSSMWATLSSTWNFKRYSSLLAIQSTVLLWRLSAIQDLRKLLIGVIHTSVRGYVHRSVVCRAVLIVVQFATSNQTQHSIVQAVGALGKKWLQPFMLLHMFKLAV